MPRSLSSIEKAADLLEKACKEMKADPFSQTGRDHLIAGSRGILQGTTAMLVAFDESQVEKKVSNWIRVLIQYYVDQINVDQNMSIKLP